MSVRTAGLASARGGVGRRQTIIVTIAVAAILLLALAISSPADDGVTEVNLAGSAGGAAPTVGSAPLPFTGRTYDGATASLADYAGQPLWLTFGASWCSDCRIEADDLQATYEQYRAQGLQVLGVFINEPASDTAGYAQRAGMTFPIISDETATIGSAYRLMGIPTHVLIGPDGLVRQVKIGALSKADMERAVATILR